MKYHTLKIIERNNRPILKYTYKIGKRIVKRNNKSRTINKFFITTFPKEVAKYFQVINREMFFYEKKGIVYITSRPPATEYQKIKIQQTGAISIPTTYFNPEGAKFAEFTLDLGSHDGWRSGKLGVLSLELIY